MDRAELRRNQIVGAVAGMILAAMTVNFFPAMFELAGGWGPALLWGAAIGTFAASFAQFGVAGKVLTRSENPVLNLAVGFMGFLVAAALLIGFVLLVGSVFGMLSR